MYKPKIKNLDALIADLSSILNDIEKSEKSVNKIINLEFEHDSSDGFEDVVDAIEAFLRKYDSNSSTHKDILNKLICMLKEERPLVEIENAVKIK